MDIVMNNQESASRRPKDLRSRDAGFTIIELVVIMMIVGLLVVVSVFGYGSWRKSVATKEVQNDLIQLASAMDSVRVWSSGAASGYPVFTAEAQFGGTDGDPAATKLFESSPGVVLTYKSGDVSQYCAEARSRTQSQVVYRLDSHVGRPEPGTC